MKRFRLIMFVLEAVLTIIHMVKNSLEEAEKEKKQTEQKEK